MISNFLKVFFVWFHFLLHLFNFFLNNIKNISWLNVFILGNDEVRHDQRYWGQTLNLYCFFMFGRNVLGVRDEGIGEGHSFFDANN
jgi:hypothetical protein